jgi:hypothetical protein
VLKCSWDIILCMKYNMLCVLVDPLYCMSSSTPPPAAGPSGCCHDGSGSSEAKVADSCWCQMDPGCRRSGLWVINYQAGGGGATAKPLTLVINLKVPVRHL